MSRDEKHSQVYNIEILLPSFLIWAVFAVKDEHLEF